MAIIAKYKFDKTIYADLLPEFNAEFTSDKYNTTDEEVDGIITRTIESDELPTLMRFGRLWVSGESTADNRTDSLLEVLEMNTSGLTNCSNMFRYNKNLTSIICEWDTSKVTNMRDMFSECYNLTSLDISNLDTNNATIMNHMFNNCYKLTSLDVSNFDTSNVTKMDYMFYNCTNLATLDVSNFNTSKVTTMYNMFYNCTKLTSLDVSNFNTSEVTNMSNIFDCCLSLTEIHGISNWDTSNVTNMVATFGRCESLIELNLSGWDISSVTNADNLFGQCFSLVTLDISNFKFSTNCNINNIFNENLGNIPLADIGMLYCNQSTINKIASALPTDATQTIWVEDVDIKDLTSVEGVEFKQYAKNTEIMLTSPLLEGDKLIVKDGKLYHWHKMGKVVLDGSESWSKPTTSSGGQVDTNWETETHTGFRTSGLINPKSVIWGGQQTCICDRFKVGILNDTTYSLSDEYIGQNTTWLDVKISKSKLSTQDTAGFKQWLQANPITAVYELASPYYELISEDPLGISLISETVDITNSSNIPLNMTINNKGMSTIAMKPSTTYTVAFDKKSEGDLTVNLCGNEVTTTDNVVEITTPSEIDDELIFYGDGVEVSNVRLLEGSVSGDSIPRESFKGLKNSFEDGYIPENVCLRTFENYEGTAFCDIKENFKGKINKFTVYIKNNSNNKDIKVCFSSYKNDVWYGNHYIGKYDTPTYLELPDNSKLSVVITGLNDELYDSPTFEQFQQLDISILEGDWTHLTEEDWNNLGKYKVEYKVTGKNLINPSAMIDGKYQNHNVSNGVFSIVNNSLYSITEFIKVKPNTKYVTNIGAGAFYRFDKTPLTHLSISSNSFTTPSDCHYVVLVTGVDIDKSLCFLEEGTEATEYEPYKSYTKTFYLNSPLLEGDTIEDVNGVATHVKRYEKVVLDGSEQWQYSEINANPDVIRCFDIGASYLNYKSYQQSLIVDKLNTYYYASSNLNNANQGIDINNTFNIQMLKSNLPSPDINGLSQWLSENPTTVVYELASPIYEPISTESILCDSYVNGHLDVDTNIPIEKVVFDQTHIYLKYIQPNTTYTLQFESDNIGKIENVFCNNSYGTLNVVKGINKFTFTTPMEIQWNILDLNGIGFNASNIQVVATDRDVNFGYFKGLQSSFEEKTAENLFDESCLSTWWLVTATNIDKTDTSGKYFSIITKAEEGKKYTIKYDYMNRYIYAFLDENYNILRGSSEISMFTTFQAPKNTKYLMCYISSNGIKEEDYDNIQVVENSENFGYEVKCKVVGKNKFDGNVISDKYINDSVYNYSMTPHSDFDVIQYKITNLSPISVSNKIGSKFQCARVIDENGNLIEGISQCWGESSFTYQPKIVNCILQICIINGQFNNIQLEEGTQATPYEPYQEYTKTIHLNSPLLKGDTIEVHNGKLCHYHKMGMVVLDGSEGTNNNFDSNTLGWYRYNQESTGTSWSFNVFCLMGITDKKIGYETSICDKFLNTGNINPFCEGNDKEFTYTDHPEFKRLYFDYGVYRNDDSVLDEWLHWLSQNPVTVVYELAEPWYEEITPTQEDLIITSVKEGDLHIDTIVPISSKVTYNVNVQLLTDFEQSIVEQVQATQTTDLQSILDEEIDN